MRKFLSEGQCRDLADGVRPDSRTGVLLSSEERREVLGRLGGGGTALLRRSGKTVGGEESCYPRQGCCGLPLGSVGRNKRRRQMLRQQSVLFHGPDRKRWGCQGRPGGIPRDGVATTMATTEMLNVYRYMDDVLIAKLAVRVAMSTRMP